MMFGFVSYADAEPGYKANEGQRGLLSTNRIREMVKQQLGLDWDTLTNEQKTEIMDKFRKQRAAQERARQQASVPKSPTEG
jgi:hypothetical protein